MITLAAAFFVTALLYAMVGFGGGSTYNALLALAETDYQLLPTIALCCNIVVVTGGAYHFSQAGQVRWRRLLPFVLLSVPMAWFGGRLLVQERYFIGLLGLALLLTAVSMLRSRNDAEYALVDAPLPGMPWLLGLPLGAGIGLLSGVVGIGGGIFLAPVLHLMRWGEARAIAAACSVFILVNSIAGLLGQVTKLSGLQRLEDLQQYAWLVPAVLIGGQLGSRIGARRLPGKSIRILTAILVAYVSLRLLYRWWVTG